MKYLSIIFLSILTGLGLFAQGQSEAEFETPFWQGGIVVTDIAVPAFSAEASFRVSPKQHIGLRMSLPSYQSYYEEDLYQSTNWGVKATLFQKFFFGYTSSEAFTLKHGPRIGMVDLYYETEAWISSQRYGNTVYTYEEVSGNDQNLVLGYDLQIGWMSRNGRLFYEVYGGVVFEQIVNTESMSVLEYRNAEEASLEYLGPGYEYQGALRPVIGVLIGLSGR